VQDADAGNSISPDTDLFLEEEDPFMAKLLTTFLEGDKAAETMLHRISQDASAVETRLRKRMAATMASASALLENVEALRSGSMGSSIPDEPKSKEVQLAALSNVLRAENKRLRDQALQDASRIKELSNSLADREDELLVAQRKIAQLRQNPEAHLPIHSLPSHTHSPAPVKENDSSEELEKKPPPAAPNGERDSTVLNVKELQELQGQLERRTAEVEARDVALSAAERYVPKSTFFQFV
jgi:hypothetical protein